VPACDTGIFIKGNLRSVTIRIYAVLALAVLAQASANVCLSKGMKYIASSGEYASISLLAMTHEAIANPLIWTGVILSIIFYALFTVALSWTDLSFVLPVIAVEVVVNVAFANYFLNESVSALRWTGVTLIAVGVILVIRSTGQGVATADRVSVEGGQSR